MIMDEVHLTATSVLLLVEISEFSLLIAKMFYALTLTRDDILYQK